MPQELLLYTSRYIRRQHHIVALLHLHHWQRLLDLRDWRSSLKMPSLKGFAVTLTALLLCRTSSAAPHANRPDVVHHHEWKRDTAPQPDVDYLEPVVPPEVDQSAVSNLFPAASVTLAWAGAGTDSAPGLKRRRVMRRDGAVFARAAFDFR